MHPRALPLCVLLQTRALPADAERIVHSVALDAHDAPPRRAANRDRIGAEAIADVFSPDDASTVRRAISANQPQSGQAITNHV
jgi:hypothetical protein